MSRRLRPVLGGGVPVVLVTGIDPAATGLSATVLALDLPGAVSVSHRIDVGRGVLTRVVSDLGGVVEREEVELAHACVSCALREDVLPTLERLARDGRWTSIVAHLPTAAPATQVCAVLHHETRLARHLHVAGVVTALEGSSLVDDLLGDDLLAERGLHSSDDDRRGVAEVACELVEGADVVVVAGEPQRDGVDLLGALVRPGVDVVTGADGLDTARLRTGRHDLLRTQAWSGSVRTTAPAPLGSSRAWTVELSSPRPFHPGRLLAGIEALGDGRHRGRGCFWLPSRPGDALAWDGAGGQLSIGLAEPWGSRTPRTHLVVTGVGTAPDHLSATFARLLLQPGEQVPPGALVEDGFEPWLGPVHDAA